MKPEYAYCMKHQIVVYIWYDGYMRKWLSGELLSVCDCTWTVKPVRCSL